MAKDIAPELLQKLQKVFREKYNNNDKIKKIYSIINEGTATYEQVNELSIEVGDILAETFQENLSSEILPDGRMYYNIAKRTIEPLMINNYDIVTSGAEIVQEELNRVAGMGIKAQVPNLNQDKIDGIVNRLDHEELFDNVKWILDEPIKNFTQAVADDAVKANANFHKNLGLNPTITRVVRGDCCDWCRAVAGSYPYDNAPADIYRRHRYCRCTVEYDPGDGVKKSVWK